MVIGDDGYPYPKDYHDNKIERFVRSRHEHINKRFHFGGLRHKFVNDLANHAVCFRAVSNLTQLATVSGEPLYKLMKRFMIWNCWVRIEQPNIK